MRKKRNRNFFAYSHSGSFNLILAPSRQQPLRCSWEDTQARISSKLRSRFYKWKNIRRTLIGTTIGLGGIWNFLRLKIFVKRNFAAPKYCQNYNIISGIPDQFVTSTPFISTTNGTHGNVLETGGPNNERSSLDGKIKTSHERQFLYSDDGKENFAQL